MDFGRLPGKELNAVDLKLMADPAFNKKILKGKAFKKPNIYIGCAKWGRKEWLGKLYPLKTPEKKFLEQYARHYNSIELNATHYKVYNSAVTQQWDGKIASENFKFCPKMYKGITHFGNLNGKEKLTTDFLKGLSGFGKHLGPVSIQLKETFSPNRKQELFDYLETLPTDLQFFVEVRHGGWFTDAKITNELFTKLKQLNIGAVITDRAGRRDCAHMYVTVPKTFIRFVGNSLHHTDYKRIDDWVKRIDHWLANGLKDLYFFMHMHDETFSPELTVYLVDEMKKRSGIDLLKPKFIHTIV